MSLRLRVTYGRAVDFLTDMEEQVSRRGLLVRVDVGTDVERGAPAELEVVTPVGRMTIQASVIQVLQGVGVAVEVEPTALTSLADVARRAARDPGPAPRFERLKDGPAPVTRTPTGERTLQPEKRTPTGERAPLTRSPTIERTTMPPLTRSPTIERTATPPGGTRMIATPPSGTRVITPPIGTPKTDTLPPLARKPMTPSTRPVTIMTEGVGASKSQSGVIPVAMPKPRAPTAPPADTSPPGVLRVEPFSAKLPISSEPSIKFAQKSEPGITPLGARLDRSELITPVEGAQRLGRQSTNPPIERARTVTPATGIPIRTESSLDSFISFTPAAARPIPNTAPPPDDGDEPELSYEEPPDEGDEPAQAKPVFGLGSETTPSAAQQHAQKIQLALHGDKNARMAILRDTNKMLHTYVLRNPQLQVDEIVTIAKMATTSIEMLSAIAARREWAERSEVALALVRNPKTPIPLAIRMLDHIGESDLRTLAKQQNVRDAVQRAARKKILG